MRKLLSLALLLTLCLFLPPVEAQPTGTLALKNPRLVYSMYGQERKEKALLPGDVFWLAYDITGLKAREDGKVFYSIGLELTAKDGTSIFKQMPVDLEAFNSLGGDSRPAYAYLEIGKDTKPGDYVMTLTVTDRTTKKAEKLTYPFAVQPSQFGFVLVGLSDPELRPTPPIGVPGQEFWCHFGVTGVQRDAKKNVDLGIEFQLIDMSTKMPVYPKAILGDIKEVEEKFKDALALPWTQRLSLNRTGQFKIQVTATDKLSKKTANLELDFRVIDPK